MIDGVHQLSEFETQKPRRERGEGRLWQIGQIWWIQYYVHGRQVRESSRSKTETVAKRLLKRRLGEVNAGLLTPASIQRLRYDSLRAAFLADYRTNKQIALQEPGRRGTSMRDQTSRFCLQRFSRSRYSRRPDPNLYQQATG